MPLVLSKGTPASFENCPEICLSEPVCEELFNKCKRVGSKVIVCKASGSAWIGRWHFSGLCLKACFPVSYWHELFARPPARVLLFSIELTPQTDPSHGFSWGIFGPVRF